jgi:hypothetical protein
MNYQPCGMPRCTNHFLTKNTLAICTTEQS